MRGRAPGSRGVGTGHTHDMFNSMERNVLREQKAAIKNAHKTQVSEGTSEGTSRLGPRWGRSSGRTPEPKPMLTNDDDDEDDGDKSC